MNEWINEWMNEWMNEWLMNEWMNKWMNEASHHFKVDSLLDKLVEYLKDDEMNEMTLSSRSNFSYSTLVALDRARYISVTKAANNNESLWVGRDSFFKTWKPWSINEPLTLAWQTVASPLQQDGSAEAGWILVAWWRHASWFVLILFWG